MNNLFDMGVLVEELNAASEVYYNTDESIMSDAEFDNKLEKLRQMEKETGTVLPGSPTKNVGSTVLDNILKVTHKTPMLSLDKCHSAEEVIKFANGRNLVSSVKLDGLTVRITYKDGELIQAESRGDGTIGGLITEHVKQFLNVPIHINKEGTYIIDGEALIKIDDFLEINKDGKYKNSRNLASGTLSNLDTSVVKDRRMRWYAWEVVEGAESNSFYHRLVEAHDLGFEIVPFFDVSKDNFDQIQNTIDKVFSVAEEENLPQDGVVFKFDDVEYGSSLGNTTHHFNNGIAFKSKNDSYETTLKNIEFTMGKTGILTPVAVFEPVNIDGSVVERASLHNISVMNNVMGRGWKGQKLGIYKANKIIPNVEWAEQFDSSKYDDVVLDVSFINIPDKCPICGQPTKIVKENESEILMCTNDDCKGRLLGKLTHAVSREALNIDGLSEATLDRFIGLGLLNSIIDIYYLSEHEKKLKSLDGFGKKSIDNLLSSIEKSRNTTLDRFLNALSIPLLGKSASKMIAEAEDYSIDSFINDMKTYGAEFFRNIPGVGDSLISSMDKFFAKHLNDIIMLSKEFSFESKESVSSILKADTLKDKVFVITGSLTKHANREELKNKIEVLGGKVSGSISSKTSYLINNDVNSASSKNKKAKSLNIPIISEDDFLKMVGE